MSLDYPYSTAESLFFTCYPPPKIHISELPLTPVFHNPQSSTFVKLPKYTISWDGSAQCDPGEIMFECQGCEEHQVRLYKSKGFFEIETTDAHKSAFSVNLTA
jgi:hypothetical protein